MSEDTRKGPRRRLTRFITGAWFRASGVAILSIIFGISGFSLKPSPQLTPTLRAPQISVLAEEPGVSATLALGIMVGGQLPARNVLPGTGGTSDGLSPSGVVPVNTLSIAIDVTAASKEPVWLAIVLSDFPPLTPAFPQNQLKAGLSREVPLTTPIVVDPPGSSTRDYVFLVQVTSRNVLPSQRPPDLAGITVSAKEPIGAISEGYLCCRQPTLGQKVHLNERYVMTGNRDIVYKRCGCADKATGRQLSGRCPQLAEPGHGSWYYAVQVSTVGGRRARYRRGGFPTEYAARAGRNELLQGPADLAAAGAWTVARWLRHWLQQAEPNLRPANRLRLRRQHQPVSDSGPGPRNPRRPGQQAAAGLLRPARPPAHPQRDAARGGHHRPGARHSSLGA